MCAFSYRSQNKDEESSAVSPRELRQRRDMLFCVRSCHANTLLQFTGPFSAEKLQNPNSPHGYRRDQIPECLSVSQVVNPEPSTGGWGGAGRYLAQIVDLMPGEVLGQV